MKSPPAPPPADREVELGVVTGRSASYVAENDAMDRVASYMPGDIIGTGTPPGVGLGQKPRCT